MTLDSAWAADWIRLAAAAVAEHRGELGELDRAIGDGDHGENLERGFDAAAAAVRASAPGTPAAVFRLTATTLLSAIGGAAGPLYGTAFLKASELAGDAASLDAATAARLIAAARDGVVLRGKAVQGEKTMVDAWTPAAEAAAAEAAAGGSPAAVLDAAASAAERGAVGTEPLVAAKGRASYLGERAVGHRDPGAASTALILRAAADAAAADAGIAP